MFSDSFSCTQIPVSVEFKEERYTFYQSVYRWMFSDSFSCNFAFTV
ncbi:hypothetical protein SLEP1_g43201 [Rubroshorea leprosula]|uniref:Uncharacterized protein n=1 Tax=Rubroshorea leprosula TaxID=152421 RepID=A0AAV5LCR7_9ROSI|nr:hypothetical protein SLEP1_g43201 [Rubroshorea leprosula]